MRTVCLSILVAMAKNRVIGLNNTLPWHLSEDLKRFKALTMGRPIIMGRKTYESIGRPLPGRINIVITRQKNYTADGAIIVSSIENATKAAYKYCDQDNTEAFIIGGEVIYRQTLHLCQKLYITEIQKEFEGDAFFPEFDPNEWAQIMCTQRYSDSQHFAYHFIELQRKVNNMPSQQI